MTNTALLQQLLGLPPNAGIQRFLKDAQRIRVKKGTVLIEPGQVMTQLPVLIEGVFRGFLLDADGRDITDCFACRQGEILMGCNALEEPSQIHLEAIMDCEIMEIPMTDVLAALKTIPELMGVYNRFLKAALDRHWEGKLLMHQCSAMGRYQWFLKHYPGLIDMVSNKHIASFLGMTPVTLSRLRRKLREVPVMDMEQEGG